MKNRVSGNMAENYAGAKLWRAFVLFTKLGVHISGKSSQKGFRQVSDIVTLIMDLLAAVRLMDQERQNVPSYLLADMMGGCLSSRVDVWLTQEADRAVTA